MKVSREVIEKILKASVTAPSGDNSQPWRFEIAENRISVYNLPGKDNPILNYEQRGSYIAHGGLIENIVIASTTFGYAAAVSPFPDTLDHALTARIELSPQKTAKDPLAAHIARRHTNRRPYEDAPLTNHERNALARAADHFGADRDISFVYTGEPKSKQTLGRAASSIEEVILEHRELHRLLFRDVVWTEREEREVRSGLSVATMEFALPQKVVFWLASHWPVIRALNVAGLSRFIAHEDAKLYATGAGVGALLLENISGEDFLLAGRAMQRVWLTATSLDLSLQPLAALVFTAMRSDSDLKKYFSERHVRIIRSNYETMRTVLGVGRRTIAMLFRIGHADPPSAVSSRKAPVIIFK